MAAPVAALVAALSLAGPGVAPAHPAAAGAGDQLRLIAPYNAGRVVSFRPEDPSDPVGAVRLVAELADPDATTTFEWNPDPAARGTDDGWSAISGPVTVTGRFASVDWSSQDATGIPEPGAGAAVRVVSTPSAGPASSMRTTVVRAAGDAGSSASARPSVELEVGGELRYFVQPYADSRRTASLSVVTGRTSAEGGAVELSAWRTRRLAFERLGGAQVVGGTGTEPGGTFAAVLDLSPFTPTYDKKVALGAELGTDHVAPTALHEHDPDRLRGEVVPGSAGEDDVVLLTVTDWDGFPVAGAEVFRSSLGSTPKKRLGYTDARGRVVATQPAGSKPRYFVNTDDSDGFGSFQDPSWPSSHRQ